MKKIFLIIGLFVSGIVVGQVNNTTDFLTEISKYDLSDLWVLNKFQPENSEEYVDRIEPIGYIGEKYQRLYMHFISAIQNPNNKLQYYVYGKTKVKNNICTFQGMIIINESKNYQDTEFPDITQGYVVGSYEFYEDPKQKGTGLFRGKFRSDYYIDKNGKIKYNALIFGANGFENNQFEGIWKGYNSTESIKCNWGDYRIPNSNNLDIGVAEFLPDDKYLENGWKNYKLAYSNSDDTPGVKEARNKEKEKWWIDK